MYDLEQKCGYLLTVSMHVLRCYIYECVKYDKSNGIAGAGYDVVYCLMEMGELFDNCHHLFTDNLFTTYAVAKYLLERGTFMTRTMRQNQLQHIPNEIVLLSQRLEKKFITGRRDTLPCHIGKTMSEQACYFAINVLWGIEKRLTKQLQQ